MLEPCLTHVNFREGPELACQSLRAWSFSLLPWYSNCFTETKYEGHANAGSSLKSAEGRISKVGEGALGSGYAGWPGACRGAN